MTITIDGLEVERADGTIRCVGYGIDGEGRVTGRFALPNGHKWDAPEPTETVEYVDSMENLPPVKED
jgi:hypothetical protein